MERCATTIHEAWGTYVGTAPFCNAHSSDCIDNGGFYWYAITEGNGHYCSSGRKVYCNDYPTPYNNLIWFGTAPFCDDNTCDVCGVGQTCIAFDDSRLVDVVVTGVGVAVIEPTCAC